MKASAFIEKLFGGRTRGKVFLATYANDRSEADKFPPRNVVTRDFAKVDQFVKQYDVAGRACYFAVNTFSGKKRSKDTVDEINALHLDIDFSGVVETRAQIEDVLKNIDCQPSAVVFSGHGLHAYWLLQPALQGHQQANVERLLRRLCEMLAGDVSTAEIARVMRLPGSHNSKRGEWTEVEVLPKLSSWRTYSLAKLDRWMEGQDPLLTHKVKKPVEDETAAPVRDENIWQKYRRENRQRASSFDAEFWLGNMRMYDVHGHGIDDTYTHIVGAMVEAGHTVDETIMTLLGPTRDVFNRDAVEGDRPWNEKRAITEIKKKFNYFTRKDKQKEQSQKEHEASELGAGVSEVEAMTSKKEMNGHKIDLDDRLPDERRHQPVIAPYDFWIMVPTERMRPGSMPAIIENVATEYATRTGMDAEVLAMSMLTCCSAVIPTGIKVAAYNDSDSKYIESIRFWQANIGGSGSAKTPTTNAVLGPFEEIEEKLRADFNQAMRGYEALTKEEQRETDRPIRSRVQLPGDITTEKIPVIFADNPDGLLAHYDELVSFFGSMSRYSNKSGGGEQSARGFWLSAYDSKPHSTERIGRGTIDCVPSCSILGGIQPSVMHELTAETKRNDGLVQRFIPVIMPEMMNQRVEIKNPKYPLTQYEQLIKSMHRSMPLRTTGATLHFSQKAELVRERMFEWVEVQFKRFHAINPQLASHINKFKGMFIRYCGLFHMIEHYTDRQARLISAETANMAYNFMTSCRLSHAEAFYNMLVQNEEHTDMQNIANYILARRLSKVGPREMQQGSGRLRKISSRDLAYTAGNMIALGWLKQIPTKRSDSFSWEVNPDVHHVFKARAAAIREKNQADREHFLSLKKGPEKHDPKHLN